MARLPSIEIPALPREKAPAAPVSTRQSGSGAIEESSPPDPVVSDRRTACQRNAECRAETRKNFRPPRVFDDYVVIAPLGSGAMGQVYVGQDEVLDRRVALKFIAADRPSRSARARFLREARAIARLVHPNVVSVYRIGEVEDRPYIAYEFVPGTSLDQIPKPMAWKDALRIGLGLAAGLSAAHKAGTIHRDIKPSNVMITSAGAVKLLDFGLARLEPGAGGAGWPPAGQSAALSLLDESSFGATREVDPHQPRSSDPSGIPALPIQDYETAAGMFLGTPAFMAPELWRGQSATTRSDVYSTGLVLYSLLAGELPHHRLHGDALACAIQQKDVASVLDVAPQTPPLLARVVERCLTRDPRDRFDTATGLYEALAHLQSMLPRESSERAVEGEDDWWDVTMDSAPDRAHIEAANPPSRPRPSAPGVSIEPGAIRYVERAGTSIAYRSFGSGPIELVLVLGGLTHLEAAWQCPAFEEFARGLGRFARVLIYDKRGSGLSDRSNDPPKLEDHAEDLRAVMDAARVNRSVVFAAGDAVPIAVSAACRWPQSVRSLVLFGGAARFLDGAGFPLGRDRARFEARLREIRRTWPDPELLREEAPTVADDGSTRAWYASYLRAAASPGNAEVILGALAQADVRELLPRLSLPTLVLRRQGDVVVSQELASDLAERIPSVTEVTLPGRDHLPFFGETDALLREIEAFVCRTGREAQTLSTRG